MSHPKSFLIFLIVATVFSTGAKGAKVNSEIVGGMIARKSEFPYQVSLLFKGRNFCGGAIISSQHILTAAHCFNKLESKINFVRVKAGTNDLSRGGTIHSLQSVVIHPDYSYSPSMKTMPKNDIAIITLTKPMIVNQLKHPIKLASPGNYHGALTVIAGWGRIHGMESTVVSQQLMELPIIVEGTDYCRRRLPRHNIQRSHICTVSYYGTGACRGDSGGPLVVKGELVGILSFSTGKDCARGSPVVFTAVYHFLDFIRRVVPEL